MKNSTKADPHEDREKEKSIESRRKKRARALSPGSERENSGVENGGSPEVLPHSLILPAPDSVETPGKLSPRQVEAIQRDYANGFTVQQIELITGVRAPTIYKYVKHVEQVVRPPDKTADNAPRDPPVSSLSPSPQSSASPPQIIQIGEKKEAEAAMQEPDPAPNGRSYETYSFQRRSRLPVPETDAETVAELLLMFGKDMRDKGFNNFPDFFEQFVIPQFARLEFWMAHVPGNTPEEKDRNLKRYLWIATKYFALEKEYREYEAGETENNGSGLKEES